MGQIKITRAHKKSSIGDCPLSAQAMLESIPSQIIAKLTSDDLAALMDANWQLAQRSKAIALREGC